MTGKHPLLDLRREERDALLERIVVRLRQDDRVTAAFLWGSLGRRQADDFSDIDIWVVIRDEALPSIGNDLSSFALIAGEPLYVMEAPYNGPIGGTCIHTAYDGTHTGAHQVDWDLQPLSTARILPDTLVLFDDTGLPCAQSIDFARNADPGLNEVAGRVQNVRFFWQMFLVCAKYVARSPLEERMGLLPYAINALNDIKRFLKEPPFPEAQELPPHPTPSLKLQVLSEMATHMSGCMARMEVIAQTEDIVWCIAPEIVPSAERLLDTIHRITTESASNKQFGSVLPTKSRHI